MGRKIQLSRTNKFIAGVCGGLGEFFNVDPTLIRIAFAVLFVVTFAFPVSVIYIILWAIMPLDA
jgi:phage shock protein C